MGELTLLYNLNCKLGIYYALTGKIPPFHNEVSWEIYFEKLKEDLKANDRDYYFLIINKNNPSDVFATSLKCLKNIVPNGNNLPFQAKWEDNRQMVKRDFEEAKEFLLGTFEQSLKLRADTYLHFKQYFPNISPSNNRFDFYIECDYCKKRNHCYLSHTTNGKILTHCRCNKE